MASSTSGNLATSTTAAKLVDGDQTSPSTVLVTNEDAAIAVRVGYTAASVDATHGLLVKAGTIVAVPLDAGEALYVASASGTPQVSYIRTRAIQRSG